MDEKELSCYQKPMLVIFWGMTASGKSTLAMQWAEQQGLPYYNTDRVRKELAGLAVTDKRPDGIDQGIYSPELSAQTYAAMLERAQDDIARGADMVVLDGSYAKRADRDAVRQAASRMGATCLFFYCHCSEEETKRRLALRAADSGAVSDGRWEIYVYQQVSFERPQGEELADCYSFSTEGDLPGLLKKIMAQLAIAG